MVWAVVSAGGVVAHAGLWTLDALAAGGAPKASWEPSASQRGFVGASPQGGGVLLFFSEVAATTGTKAPQPGVVALDPSLHAGPARPSPMDQFGPLLTTPDDHFVLWSRQRSGQFALRLLTAWPSDPAVYDLGTWPVDSDFSEVVIDPSGEWVFVPLLGRDEITVLQ